MAVVQTKIHRDASGEYSNESTKRRLVITVIVDDENDGSDTVVLGCGFRRGDTWTYGNDSDPGCELQSLVATRREKLRWEVEAIFESLADTRKLNFELQTGNVPGGGGYFNPETLDERFSVVRVTHRARQVAKDKGTFLGFFGADRTAKAIANPDFTIGDEMPIMTSNTIPLNPPVEEIEYHPAFILTTYKDIWNPNDNLIGKTNSAATTISTYVGGILQFTRQFDEDTLLCVQQDYDPYIYNGSPWNTVTLEFVYNENGWQQEILDAGIVELRWTEGTSGGGGTTFNYPRLFKRILDASGNPISDPVPFDGLGFALAEADRHNPDNAVFLHYRTKVQTSFAGIYSPIT